MNPKIFLGVPVGAAAAVAGLLYLIAGQTEQQFQARSADLPQQVTLSAENYRRGLLHAEADQVLALDTPPGLPRRIRLEHRIDYTLLATPTRIYSRLFNADRGLALLPPQLALAELHTDVALDGSGHSHLDVPAFAAANGGLSWAAGRGSVDFDRHTVQARLALPALDWQAAKLRFAARDVHMNGAMQEENRQGSVQLGEFSQHIGAYELFAARSGTLNWEVRGEPGLLDFLTQLEAAQVRLGGAEYHAARLKLGLKRVDAESFYALLRALANLQNQEPALMWMATLGVLEQVQILLKKRPELDIERLELQAADGRPALAGSLRLRSVDSSMGKLSPLMVLHDLDIAARLEVRQSFIHDLARMNLEAAYRSAGLDVPPADELQKQAARQVDQILRPLQEKGYVTLDQDLYRGAFKLEQGQWRFFK